MKWHLTSCKIGSARNFAGVTDVTMVFRFYCNISAKQITLDVCMILSLFSPATGSGLSVVYCLMGALQTCISLDWEHLVFPLSIALRRPQGKCELPPASCASMGMNTEHMPQSSSLLQKFRRMPLAYTPICNFNFPTEHFNQKPLS